MWRGKSQNKIYNTTVYSLFASHSSTSLNFTFMISCNLSNILINTTPQEVSSLANKLRKLSHHEDNYISPLVRLNPTHRRNPTWRIFFRSSTLVYLLKIRAMACLKYLLCISHVTTMSKLPAGDLSIKSLN